ncbi:FAD dependent oxidoreductase [Xylariaceae sp. FL0594]|nr:FAD dependent oxidoreductase [Xylariaceae sp. FL0594]
MDIIIIGTGVFGLSAANHIHQKLPHAKLSIISRPSHLAPSDDISKVVRVDYTDLDRIKEARESLDQWWKDFPKVIRSTGRIVVSSKEDRNLFHDTNNSRQRLGMEPRILSDSGIMKKVFGASDAPDSLDYVYNWDDAIVDWEDCIAQLRKRARDFCVDSGGVFYESTVDSLDHHNGQVTTIVLEDGQRIETAKAEIVLAVGPWFTDVLDKSSIPYPPPGRIPIATGIFSFVVQMNDKQIDYFKDKPMISHNGIIDFLPPAGGGKTGKLTWIEPFTNGGASSLSRVDDFSNTRLARAHMAKAVEWARKFIPALEGASIVSINSFWDGVTQTQVPLLARHPEYSNLVCAAGGSFNRAKDLPTLGGYIVDLLAEVQIPDQYGWSPGVTLSRSDQPRLVGRGDFTVMEKAAEQERKEDSLLLPMII